ETDLIATTVSHLMADPETPEKAYAIVGNKTYQTTNYGHDWTAINLGSANFFHVLAIDPNSPDTLYATTENDALLKSNNGGQDWEVINIGQEIRFSHIKVSPHNPDFLYGISNFGTQLFSNDGGQTWTSCFSEEGRHCLVPSFVKSIAFDPHTPGIIYFGTKYHGIFKITGEEGSVQIVNGLENAVLQGFPPAFNGINYLGGLAQIHGLVADPDKPGVMYAGVADNGLYKSINSGESWFPIPMHEEAANISTLSISGDTLYAGTVGTGVFRLTGVDKFNDAAFFHMKTGQLALSAVDIGLPQGISMTMKLVDPSKLVFEVESFAETSLAQGAVGQFDSSNNALYIPHLRVGNTSYIAELTLQDTSAKTSQPPQFTVTRIEALIDSGL
ncbi:MAG: hypothetical protein AAF512_11255, partial [Pseudomonadota bacterium]